MESIYITNSCIRCNCYDIVTHNADGDVVCRECGEVQLGRLINQEEEWREFNEDDRLNASSLSRCSNDESNKFNSTSTFFTGGKSKEYLKTLAKCQILSTNPSESTLIKVGKLISEFASKLGLTKKAVVSECLVCIIYVVNIMFIFELLF